MGVSVTRIVKFIRKGKGVIVAQSRNVYNYTYKEWTQFYGLSGRSVNWDGIINVSDFSVDDTMVINGTVSDKQRITISLYAKVTAIDTNRAIITAQSLYYIASGENGEDGAKGDRGPALRGPQAWSDCAVGYVFQSGASGEEYKDVVLYGGYYYSCIKSHTKTASNNPGSATDTNSGLWKLADPVEIVATKILLAQYALVKNLGVEAIDMKDANGNIIFQAKDGNVTCNSGTFKNITVKGNSSFEGSVKANMFYGTVRKVTPGSTYTIDPVNEPYNFYYVENPTKRTFIVLPKAANYDGLEINIFTKMPPSSSLSYRTIVKAQDNDDFYVKQNAAIVSSNIAVEKINVEYTNFKNDVVTTVPNAYIRFKCIGGAWYAISGQFTGE
nr:MAG TPA: Fibronectin type III protein [Caudoviricetes sp.]